MGYRLTVFSGVLVAASVSVACLLAYEESKQSLERHLGEHLLAVVNTAAPQLDGDLLARIAAGADGELRGVEEFEELRGILVRVKDANGLQSHGSPLYVLRAAPGYAQDGELEFAVMTDRDANGKYFVGNRYRAEAHNRRALQGQAAATGVYQDAEGSWISAAAPIRDGTGRVVALLQADRPVDFFYAEARRQAVAIFAGGLLCLAVALALAIWLGRSFAEPLERLAEVTGAIAGGRLDTRVALDRNDELGDLGESVNRMAAELEAGRVQLESALEETRKASEAKTEFLATMSHELRTPMNGVMGFAALLLDTGLTALQRHYVQTIDLSANSLLAIINDVLDFSKMDSGKLTVEQVAFSPAVVAEEAAAMLMPAAAAKALRLECQVDPGVSEFILGDPLRFRQVAVNLLGNGIKFTSRGFVRIRLRQRDGDGGPLLRVEVEDTGIGIDTATQARLFRPFVQADSSTTRRYGGTGLGLAISRRLVELMAGSIGVESATGKGSRFWYEVPAPPFDGAGAGLKPAAAEHLDRPLLVLNGNADPEPAVPRHLRLAGYRLTVCGDSAEACAILTEATAKGDPIPLAIVDSPTPMADAERLRQVDGGLKMIVVAELHRRPEWREQERAGISHCLPKPVSRALLLKTVAEALAELPRLEAKGPAQASAGKRAGQLRILVAEDNALNRELALALLRKLGCEAKTALNGAEAVKAAAGEEFDLILMDCHMPEVDGYEATRQIRSREAGRRHTTIFALTASAMDGERERCLAAGMDGFLTKPIHIGEFRAVVNACCERLPERGPAPGGAAACVAEISPARG